MTHQTDDGTTSIPKQALPPGIGPSWKGNLLVFGFLIIIVLAYFAWQTSNTQKGFLKRKTSHSQMLAGMISFSLKNANSSEKTIEKNIQTFLGSTAQFIDYQDFIKPFKSKELAAVVDQANLAGVKILHFAGPDIEAPAGWSPDISCQPTTSSLLHLKNKNLYLLVLPRMEEPGCILVGFDSSDTKSLMEEIGIERLLDGMTNLPLIQYARLEKIDPKRPPILSPEVHLIKNRDNNVAETIMPFDDKRILVVGMDANRYVRRVNQLKEEFILFSILLAGLGIFFSWLLYRYQITFIGKVTDFQKQLAKQHEEAALGRASASISHEIKNPLNAIGMGLQRLQIEMNFSGEYEKLLSSMRQAVKRTSNIINDLKQHTQPISPVFQSISPSDLIEAALSLHKCQLEQIGIKIRSINNFPGKLSADESLLGQVIENLIKNAIEAQPDGGHITLEAYQSGEDFVLTIENSGFTLGEQRAQAILEPYFTTKTKGTGLGLAICKRIIESHNGELQLEVPKQGVLRISILVPIIERFV